MKQDAPVISPTVSKDWRPVILHHASELFDQVGYHAATMDDLAAMVGLAKPSLYYYFRSKEAILYELSYAGVVHLTEQLQSRSGMGLTSSQAILEAMADVLQMAHEHPGWMRVLVEFTGALSDESRDRILALRETYQQELEKIVGQAMDNGDIRRADVVLATRAIFGMCNWAYRWIKPEDQPRQIAYMFWDVAFNGLHPH